MIAVPEDSGVRPLFGKWYVLVILTIVYTLNIADRFVELLARPERFELPTPWFVGACSIH